MIIVKLLLICLAVLTILDNSLAWRRRRRRSCSRVNCAWSGWSSAHSCSASCGPGTQLFTRSVARGASCGGSGCSGSSSQTRSCNAGCCPRNCAWASWGGYSSCSRGCGGGTQTRSRGHAVSAACRGAACSGPTTQSRACNTQCCPVHCSWASWGSYGTCSRNCGGGSQTRVRSFAVTPTCGGSKCPGPSSQTQTCNTHCCKRHCSWGSWSGFGTCSRECGGGTQTRSRPVAVTASCGGDQCPGSSSSSRNCNTQCCPVHCVWGPWGDFGSCSKSCGSGSQERTRSVAIPPHCGGIPCIGSNSSSQLCNSKPCPIDCVWGDWTQFGACPVSCGGGTQTRSRVAAVTSQHGGTECAGPMTSSQTCGTAPCPVDCVWGQWGEYGACNVTCGGGIQTRARKVSVAALYGGKACLGDATMDRACNDFCCPVDCVWDSWGEFSPCSKSCGHGSKARSRRERVIDSCDGLPCEGSRSDRQPCNTHNCPVHCQLGSWGEFGDCSASCGGGQKKRSRRVSVPAKHGGDQCTEALNDTATCNENPCPVDCLWGAWSEFSSCSLTCGSGVQHRTRTVVTVAKYNGKACVGSNNSSQQCNTQHCPIDCQFGSWGEFSSCSVTCGGGTQFKLRRVSVSAKFGGAECIGSTNVSRSCNDQCCPVDCVWGDWTEFDSCTLQCGGGTQNRTREVAVKKSCGGADCYGSSSSSQACNTRCCPVDCQWEDWSQYGECTAQCGTGSKFRTRPISVPSLCGGKRCKGGNTSATPCNTHPCPIDCLWGPWGTWGKCNATCEGGFSRRERVVKVQSNNGGFSCSGSNYELKICNEEVCCPYDCVWKEWQDWTPCSKTCGRGEHSRTRQSEAEVCGGSPCSGNATEVRICNDVCCPLDCQWKQWSQWGSCSKSCGSGLRERSRSISRSATCNGKECLGAANQTETCNTDCCPVDCQVSSWAPWSDCPAECGVSGVSSRTRNITLEPECQGLACPPLTEEKHCKPKCYNGGIALKTSCNCMNGWSGPCCDIDLDECSLDIMCVETARCINNLGSYTCQCKDGFTGDGNTCSDINECASNSHGCHENAVCENLHGSHACYCKKGLSGDGYHCEGINECVQSNPSAPACGDNAVCTDKLLGYDCTCKNGFTGDPYLTCADIDECEATCNGAFISCTNTIGGFECACPEYMSLVGSECIENPPSFDFRVDLNKLGKTDIQKLALYGIAGVAVVLIVALISLRVYKTRLSGRTQNPDQQNFSNANYDETPIGDGFGNSAFAGDTIKNDDL